MESAIADAIVERFLLELASISPDGPELAAELSRLIDDNLVRREDALVALYQRLAGARQ
jgi:hypothetical protein